MWPLCTANSFLWLLLPLIIGLITGWWVWGGRRVALANNFALPEAPPAPTLARVAMPPIAPGPVPLAAVPSAPVIVPAAPALVPQAPPPSVIAPAVSAVGPAGLVGAAMTAIGIPGAIGDPDDLLQVKGIGPKLNTLLISLGIRRFDQIAAWGGEEIAKVDGHLGTFKGRIVRDAWVEQAGLLARGDIAGFEAKFGKLDSDNKS